MEFNIIVFQFPVIFVGKSHEQQAFTRCQVPELAPAFNTGVKEEVAGVGVPVLLGGDGPYSINCRVEGSVRQNNLRVIDPYFPSGLRIVRGTFNGLFKYFTVGIICSQEFLHGILDKIAGGSEIADNIFGIAFFTEVLVDCIPVINTIADIYAYHQQPWSVLWKSEGACIQLIVMTDISEVFQVGYPGCKILKMSFG